MSFKRSYRDKNGNLKPVKNRSFDFVDHTGTTHRITAFSDKSATDELRRNLKKLVSLRMAGIGPDGELARFLESCPKSILEKLGTWGVISKARTAAGKGLLSHLADWKTDLEARGNTKKHVAESTDKAQTVCTECRWRAVSDISSMDLTRWLNEARQSGKAAATVNHYLRATKSFCNWLFREKRISENHLVNVKLLNAKADRRILRRKLSVEDLGRLLGAAKEGGIVHGMTGNERYLLYRLAANTGYRWSEIRSFIKASFDFEGREATLTIKPEDAKNRQGATIPLPDDLAIELKAHMALFMPTAKLFPGMWKEKGSEMLKVDLKAAGIPFEDSTGMRFDFHSFRGQLASMLNDAGIPLVTAQQIMRHQDPKTTSEHYTRVLLSDMSSELAKLPTVPVTSPHVEAAEKTGTDDELVSADSEITVSPTVSKGTDSEDKIKTYMEVKGSKAAGVIAFPRNEKTLIPQGDKGVLNMAPPAGFDKSYNLNNNNLLQKKLNIETNN